MYPVDSSIASSSSPFSARSTIASSPEATSGGNDSLSGPPRNGYPTMQAVINAYTSTHYKPYPDHRHHIQPVADVKPNISASSTSSRPSTSTGITSVVASNGSAPATSRSEPPKRLMEVEGLSVASPSVEEIVGTSHRNKLLLQGDPQVIQKQRVETAIRVILDLLRLIPPSLSHPVDPTLSIILPRDASGNYAASFERIATFTGIRLQAGTTTKASSKKQLSAGVTPKEQLAYVETAVYMSGEGGKRVFVCRRCRLREARRRQSKDASRKKQSNSESDTSSSNRKPRPSLVPPSLDYITSENPDQYDTHKEGQVVEEPPWDPSRPDWRHEIVLFNSPPEVPIKDGSCVWLPFRVVCYGKCHGEKVGFRIIATEMTPPIRITDDHKTDTKAKPRTDIQPTALRNRKGRQSAASSRKQSPAQSEDEQSVHSFSGVGAILQKQTPQVRAGKPYERPPSQSPATAFGTLPMDHVSEQPIFQGQQSASSIRSGYDMAERWSRSSSMDYGGVDDRQNHGTVSPGALRRPHFRNLTALDGSSNLTSPNLTSPINGTIPYNDDLLYMSDPSQSPVALMSALGFNSLGGQSQPQAPMLFSHDHADVDLSSDAMASGFDGLFTSSNSHTSASSYTDGASVFSGGFGNASLYSDSGVVPETGMEGFLDFSGGDDQGLINPFSLNHHQSPPMGGPLAPLPFEFQDFSSAVMNQPLNPQAQLHQDAQLRNLLATISQQPPQPSPVITHVIPGEGTMAGGIQVAIAGRLFSPGAVILFGQRPAVTKVISDGFVECVLPPSSFAGDVEVTVQGAPNPASIGGQTMIFKYTNTDKEIMRLALEVRDQYQNSSSDAAYRLAQHVARSHSNSEWSERSSLSPPGSNPSPTDAASAGKDLQTTLITFLSTLDENAPGSLRRSGAINHRDKSQQTLLHLATVMGFHRLVRRLIVVGAHLDLQDNNGFTPLAFAALSGQVTCARVLLEAGASYDRPTVFGEMPLDLSKAGEHAEVETLLLSAVWSTAPEDTAEPEVASEKSVETTSEIDDDNPSDSGSDSAVSRVLRPPKKFRGKGKGRRRGSDNSGNASRRRRESRNSVSGSVEQSSIPADDPPPYAPADHGDSHHDDPVTASWMSRTLSNSTLLHPHFRLPLPEAVWGRLPLPSIFDPEKWVAPVASASDGDAPPPHGWVAFPAPSWESLSKLTSPDEVKQFTQAMAAAAMNAVVQSGATTTSTTTSTKMVTTTTTLTSTSTLDGRQSNSRSGTDVQGRLRIGQESPEEVEDIDIETSVLPGKTQRGSRSGERRRRKSVVLGSGIKVVEGNGLANSGSEQNVKYVKQDRMLYMFWLPVLLFVGFWLMVTALPIATGFSLIYARQITRAIKQRM